MKKGMFIIILFYCLNACATYETISHFSIDSPKLYGGTRLDKAAISEDDLRLRVYQEKFDITPPENPGLDIGFSFVFDTLLLPVTLPIILYDVIFE